jgi:predicted ATPase/DNA-binding XRE family transcriptional regulator
VSPTETFGALLRQYRVAASLSQEALGARAGLSPNAIAALERGRRKVPRPGTLLQLADALQLGLQERAALIGAANTQQADGAAHDTSGQSVPVPLTSFVGREQSLHELRALLETSRLVTLTGPGGVGKSRLAVELVTDLPDIAFVQLAPVADGALVSSAVASTLGVRDQPGRTILQTLGAVLGSRRLLMVLDNCEHVLNACAELADTLLPTCRELRILATSREPLALTGEVVWSVPGLSLPDPQSPTPGAMNEAEAVRLFTERARAALPAFVLRPDNAPAVAEICLQLDGLPLAIELAAVRIRALSPAQIASRLNDRFRLLASVNRTATARHRSLQAAIDWSYGLLSPPEQVLLDRLAVFAGG